MPVRYRFAKCMACASAVLILCCSASVWAADTTDIEALEGSSWWAEVHKNLREEEHKIGWNERAGVFQAVNREVNLRALFGRRGVEVVPRTRGVGWQWRFELTSFGRGSTLRPAGHVRPEAEGRRVQYRHGAITEWYVNRDDGIEQGFIIHERPEGDGALVVRGRLAGSLDACLDPEGKMVSFLWKGHRVLEYGKLTVEDADGRVISSRLALEGENLVIRIEGEGRYPITVDPLLTTPAWTAESDQVSAYFGCSVSGAGDVNGDSYDDVIVGAYGYDNGQEGEGRAYVYHGSPTGLSTIPAWTAESNQVSAWFGCSVSGAGDVNADSYDDVIVGASSYNAGRGRAFVYHGGPTGLSTTPGWTAEGSQTGASLGCSVSGAGDVNGDSYDDVIVGASSHNAGQGRAYVYHGGPTGLSSTPAWTAAGDQAGASFGCAVSGAGDVNGDSYGDVIVGASSHNAGQGRAYVYHGGFAGPSSTPAWIVEGDLGDAQFGVSVSDAGDVNEDFYDDVIVGANQYLNEQGGEGRAYVYHGGPMGLSSTPAWIAQGDLGDAQFGVSVSGAGDVDGDSYDDVIVGASDYGNEQAVEGRAYVYHGSPIGPSSTPAWIVEGNQEYAYFGCSVSGASDVNGDSYDDVIVGARDYSNGQSQEGRAYAYHGSPDPVCSVEFPSLNMGTVYVGSSKDTTFWITNAGGGTLTGSVSESCEHYGIVSGGGTYSLGAGESVTVTVRFDPVASGTHACTVETGSDLCMDIDFTGDGETATAITAENHGFRLEQNYPNPFNPNTEIRFSVDRGGHVLLAVFDISGRPVRTLVNRWLAEGTYTEDWDARDADGHDLASGVYFVRLISEGRMITRKTVLLR